MAMAVSKVLSKPTLLGAGQLPQNPSLFQRILQNVLWMSAYPEYWVIRLLFVVVV
jgi:hypothetical protein